MHILCILDATHYPIAVYFEADSDKAYRELERHNKGLTTNLCYLIRSRIHSEGWKIERST